MRWTSIWLMLLLSACVPGNWVNIQGDQITSFGGRVVVLSRQDPPLYLLNADLIDQQQEGVVRRMVFRAEYSLEELRDTWRDQLQGAGWREVCQEYLGIPLFGGPYLRLRYNKGAQDISLLAKPVASYTYQVELRRPPARGTFWGCPLD